VFTRRRDDPVQRPPPAGDELPRIAVEWLGHLLQDAFTGGSPPAFPLAHDSVPEQSSPEGEAALRIWRREWLSRWRRLQLPDQLSSFRGELEECRTAEDVHAVFAAFAASIVGAYVCLVFLPGEGEMLTPIPQDGAGSASHALWIRGMPVAEPVVLERPDLTSASGLDGVAPLFDDGPACALLVSPYAGGCAVLVERRRDRRFEPMDGELLNLLAGEAVAMIRRLDLLGRLGVGGVAPRERIETVLRQAHAGAALGLEMTVMRLGVETPLQHASDPEALMRHCASVIRRESRGSGPAVRIGECEFLLVLNGSVPAAETLLGRIREAFGEGARIQASIEPHHPLAPAALLG
jgi:hypothetical protein